MVIGVGSAPITEWLAGSGIPLAEPQAGGGVLADEVGRTSVEGVWAVGDVAAWRHDNGRHKRVEHWTNAGDHASIMSAHLTGKPRPAPTLPYVWSDQYGRRIQIIGRPAAGEVVAVTGSMQTADLVALYAAPDGRLVGGVVVDDPRLLMRLRKAIQAGAAADDVVATVVGVTV